MSTNKELYESFLAEIKSLSLEYNEPLAEAIFEYLVPTIHQTDAGLVACTDEDEVDYIKKEFLIGKLGLAADDNRLDAAIENACNQLGMSNRHKNRSTFYYILMMKLGVDASKLS